MIITNSRDRELQFGVGTMLSTGQSICICYTFLWTCKYPYIRMHAKCRTVSETIESTSLHF